jgi:hypothetical protein
MLIGMPGGLGAAAAATVGGGDPDLDLRAFPALGTDDHAAVWRANGNAFDVQRIGCHLIAHAIDLQRAPADQVLVQKIVAGRQIGDADTQRQLQPGLTPRRCAGVTDVTFDAELAAINRHVG